MSEPKVYTLACRGTFLAMFRRKHVTIKDHWNDQPDSKPLKIVARQIVLEDGTIIRLTVG